MLEPYFRDMSLEDFEALVPKPLSSSNWLDPCLIIPFVGSGKKQLAEHADPSDVAVVAENSNSNLISGKENEDPENCRVRIERGAQQSSDFVGHSMRIANTNETSEVHCEQDMQEVILQQGEQPVVIQLDPGMRDGAALPGCKQNLDASLNWLLGARGRSVLTSERPNKKRKLLGADAGLERLVWLPPLPGEIGSTCDVCCLGEIDAASNRMLSCSRCKMSVHQKCYGVQVMPDGYWICAWCDSTSLARRLTLNDEGRIVSMPCVLCPKEKGALKPVKCEPGRTADGGNQNFAHLFCSLWAPDVFVEDMDAMEPVTNIGDIPENRTKMVCSLCKVMHGACVRCSHGTCRACFHPICARESKHQMEIWGKSGLKNVELRIFCSKHSRVRSISSVHNANGATEQDITQVGLDDENFTTDMKQQMRFTRKTKDKFMNGTSISSSLPSLNKMQTSELVTSPCTARAIETQIQHTHMVVDQPTGDGNLASNSSDDSTVLRKLVDQGKVDVGDIESELGLSSESLEAALVPETATFSPGLKMKIIKLLQNSVHVPSVQVKPLKESSITLEGTLLRSESKNLSDSQPGSELEEGTSSFDHSFPEGDKANKDWSDSVENCLHTGRNFDDDHISGQRVLNIDGYRSYVHPYLEKKLQDLCCHISNQNKQAYYPDVSCAPHDQNLDDSSTKLEQSTEIATDQASKAESSDILEHSPRDEIEGEIIYFQSRLLNDIAAKNQRYEDLISKVVQSLSHEMDSCNKRKWDHIIVNQFLRDIREAKKRGNTERRHKEAQAILAAAAPAPCVAPSSRNVTFKQNAENDAVPVKQESIKVNTGSLRVSQLTLLPQAKDLPFSNTKVSADSNFGIFDLAKFSKKNGLPCDVCMRRETVLNRVFLCSSCKAAVHLDCYQCGMTPTGPWKCERCQEMLSDAVVSASPSDCSGAISWLVQCGLCHGTSGAFRKTTKGQWVHAFCAEWLLEDTFRRGQHNAVDGMEENLLNGKDTCSICHHNVGSCLKCSTIGCQVTFHPACARDAGLYMNPKKIGNLWRHKAFCGNHSSEQRKVDSQQYGPVEVMIMKQMRVELERLCLLCERIVKREKEKKELVVCEHDILAVKRDYVAFSIRTPFYTSGPGASSESATTSVNNNSYSGKRQRSDDITVRSDDVTVDSTISRNHTVGFPMHSKDTDRNTADSSTSTISYKRKLDDGELLADKNLEERPVIASKNFEDGEMKSIQKKYGETVQNELVTTCDQAMSQKQPPPKRYVYTRKKKQRIQDVVQVPGDG